MSASEGQAPQDGRAKPPVFKWTDRMEEAYEAALERIGGLEAAKPRAVLEEMGDGFPELTAQAVKWHLLAHRRRAERRRLMEPAGITPPTKLAAAYEAAVARLGGLQSATPKPVYEALVGDHPDITLQVVKTHMQKQRRKEQQAGQQAAPASSGPGSEVQQRLLPAAPSGGSSRGGAYMQRAASLVDTDMPQSPAGDRQGLASPPARKQQVLSPLPPPQPQQQQLQQQQQPLPQQQPLRPHPSPLPQQQPQQPQPLPLPQQQQPDQLQPSPFPQQQPPDQLQQLQASELSWLLQQAGPHGAGQLPQLEGPFFERLVLMHLEQQAQQQQHQRQLELLRLGQQSQQSQHAQHAPQAQHEEAGLPQGASWPRRDSLRADLPVWAHHLPAAAHAYAQLVRRRVMHTRQVLMRLEDQASLLQDLLQDLQQARAAGSFSPAQAPGSGGGAVGGAVADMSLELQGMARRLLPVSATAAAAARGGGRGGVGATRQQRSSARIANTFAVVRRQAPMDDDPMQ